LKKESLSLFVVAALLAMGGPAGCSEMQANSSKPQAAATDEAGQGNTEAAKPVAADAGKSAPVPQSDPEPMTLEQAQARLNELGFKIGKVDGRFGPRTRAGLKRFQKEQGLPVTGELDSTTIAKLSK
jgi:peptidoglycan hydrolase-like protein with peptidoglycan-binding domain